MKLSEALVLGECAVPPHHEQWYAWDRNTVCGACAVGRMCLVAGYTPKPHDDIYLEAQEIAHFMNQKWPWTRTVESDKYFHRANPVLAEISYRYECMHMSMRDIAAYVATIEPPEAPVEAVEAAEQVSA